MVRRVLRSEQRGGGLASEGRDPELLRLSKRAVFSLSIALDRRLAVIVCVARDLDTMRISKAWLQAINNGRMLLLSTFLPSDRRLTEERSHERNRFAALLADEIFIVHADRGSHTEQLGTYARTKGKRLVAPA